MYKARCYVGKYAPGDRIPEGYLSGKRAEQLLKAGAIEKIGPAFSSHAMDEGNATSSAPAGQHPFEEEGKGNDGNTEMPDEGAEEAAADEPEGETVTEEEAEEEVEAPEIDPMAGIVAEPESETEAKPRKGGRRK